MNADFGNRPNVVVVGPNGLPVEGASPAWHLYVVSHPHVERLEGMLTAADVGHKAYYRTPVHRQKPMLEWGAAVELPATDQAAGTHLAIPMSPVLSLPQVEEVVAATRGLQDS